MIGKYDHSKIRGKKKHPLTNETKIKISEAKRGSIPWNKGKKGLQVAWNLGIKGSSSGRRNGMFIDGLSANSYLGRKEATAGRKRAGICEVCYKIAKTDFDHDHKTGKFRGWICRRCNLTLGMVQDNQTLLRLLADYLDYQYEEKRPRVVLKLDAFFQDNSDKEDNLS